MSLIKSLLLWVLLSVALPVFAAANATPAEDGFVLVQWGPWDIPNAVASVEDARQAGARHISIELTVCQEGKNASDVHWCDEVGVPFEATSLHQNLVKLISEIRARGMSFSLLPILHTGQGDNRQWTWPHDRAAWFKSYGDRIEDLARFSNEQGAPSFIVGSELTLLFFENSGWRDVIQRVRRVYSGHITISSFFAQFPLIRFWDALDSIGLSYYFPLTVNDRLNAQFLLNSAALATKAELLAFAALHHKPLMFVEVGYPSTSVAASRPWDYDWAKRKVDFELSRQCWESFRNAWSHEPRLRAFQIWALDPANDRQQPKLFSPLHKPAEENVRRLFEERARL